MSQSTNNILFIGSKSSGLELLKVIHKTTEKLSVITFDDSEDIRTRLSEFKEFTSENNIPLYIAKSRSDSEISIKAISPDICFVMGWYWIFSEDILNSVPNGFIGIHYSLLPKYRGFSPLVWSVINGESESGFSIFSMSTGMDEGDIWLQKKISIGKDEYINEIMERFEKEVVSSFSELLPEILNGTAKPLPQDHSQASFTTKRTPESGKIDWNKSSKEIYNFIRAQSDPYPGAFTFFNGSKIVIKKAELTNEDKKAFPGEVLEVNSTGVKVQCGDKTIILKEFEMNGSKGTAEDFFTSINIKLT